MGTNPYLYLPLDMRQDLCMDLLRELGITDIRHNPKKHELTHACLLSDHHTDQDRNPTCSLNYEKLVVKCLGCQASGSLLWFLAVARGEGSKDARRWMESKVGGGEEKDLNFLLKFFDALYSERVESEPIPTYNVRAIEGWALEGTHPYLESRGISEDNVHRFGLGYDSEKDGIVIPHHWRGNLVGWQTRKLSGERPKYYNTPRFPKADTLFSEGSGDRAVVVEAPMSAIRHGDVGMMATFGANVSKTQISFLQKYDEVILWFDNDAAGWKATERVGKALMGMPVWVVDSPFSGDPGDYDTETVRRLLKNNLTPFAVWNRPRLLLCYRCYEPDHSGECDVT